MEKTARAGKEPTRVGSDPIPPFVGKRIDLPRLSGQYVCQNCGPIELDRFTDHIPLNLSFVFVVYLICAHLRGAFQAEREHGQIIVLEMAITANPRKRISDGGVNAIREQKCFHCSPFYGRACRWAMLGEIKT